MKKFDAERLAPPGFPFVTEQALFWIGIAIAACYSFLFFSSFSDALDTLYLDYSGGRRVLDSSAVMPDFKELLGSSLYGFPTVACSTIFFVVLHYTSFSQGSKSIYLMRRLPDPWELHKRCLTLPLLGAVTALVLGFVVLLLYFGIYEIMTPNSCLMPDQWAKLWR